MKNIILPILLCMLPWLADAQKITYSVPDDGEFRNTNFEIIGKMGSDIAIYKNFKTRHDICLYDSEMMLKRRIKMDFLPDRIINVDFISYLDYTYMIYQYQKKNILYCTIVKLNSEGKLMSDPIDLDTSLTTGQNENKIYNVINSDDKKKILVFKMKRQQEKNYQITSLLYDNEMKLIKKAGFNLQVNDREGIFTDFLVNNDGDFVFGRCGTTGSKEYINKLDLLFKRANDDNPILIPANLKEQMLDEVKLKFDNYNKRIITSAFFYKQKRGNVEGLYTMLWDHASGIKVAETSFPFNDSLRIDARGENGSLKAAFNDYFINHIIAAQDGGFLVAMESYSSSSKTNPWNRFDYLYGNRFFYPYDLGYYSPFNRMNYMFYDPFNRFGQNNLVRYNAENIMVFFFNADGKLNWSNTVRKAQYEDNTDSFISYQLFNTGSELRFLFNQREKRALLLNSATIDGDGRLKRQPTLKNLNREYEFMPKFGKQVGLRQFILPCNYRNYICFAKVEF